MKASLEPLPGRRLALRRPPRAVVVALAAAVVVGLALLRQVTGPEIAFSGLFLIPVAGAAWYAGRIPAAILALLSILLWVWADLQAVDEFRSQVLPLVNGALRLAVFLCAAVVVAALRRTMEEVQELALHDPLTGLANRRAFLASAEELLALCRRHGAPVALLFLDVDRFKDLNDTRGHAAGDELLGELGAVLRDSVRASDLVGRLGGDEFVVLLPEADAPGLEVVRTVLEDAMTERITRRWGLTVSIGEAAWPRAQGGVEELVREADRALYRAKDRHERGHGT